MPFPPHPDDFIPPSSNLNRKPCIARGLNNKTIGWKY